MAMDWDKLRIFHAVAEAGSFTHAGDTLNLSQSAVSRQISALEDSLGTPLFHRHARGLILTEQGELLYRTAHEVFAKLAMTEAALSEAKDRAKGPLKVTAPVAFGSMWLTPRMRDFLDRYPDIQLSLLLDETELDLGMRQADVAIRMTPPRQPDLVQRHLVTVSLHLYASQQYLQEHGTPQSTADLEKHRLVVFGAYGHPPSPSVNWLRDIGGQAGRHRPNLFTVNSVYGILRALQSSVGIGAVPDYMIEEAPNLVRVLPELAGPSVDAYFVYPEELRHSKRIAVFRDYLVARIAETRF